MERVGVLATALVLSLLAALTAAAQLVDHIWYGEDFGLFVVPISAFAAVILVIFGVADAYTRGAGGLRIVALALAIMAIAITLVPGLVGHIAGYSKNPPVVLRANDRQIAVTLLVPMLLAVVIQWRVVRRGWLRRRGDDFVTAWPWITIVVACVVIFSPIGLAVLGSAIAQSVTDWFRGLWVTVSLIMGGLLLLAGLIEWRIRSRKLRARRNAAPPPGAATPGTA